MAVVERLVSFEGFPAWLGRQGMKYEYDPRWIIPQDVAMPGATGTHNRIEANPFQEIANRFEGSSYVPLTSNRSVATEDGETAYFPDGVLLDGGPRTVRYGNQAAAISPAVVPEVSSPGTEKHDNEKHDNERKLEVYRSIPTRREVVLLKSNEARAVRHFRCRGRLGRGGGRQAGRAADDPGVEIPMARIYRNAGL